MAIRPPDELKNVANALAALLAKHEGGRALGLMQRLGLFGESEPESRAQPSESSSSEMIGIWAPEIRDGKRYWVRREGTDAWWPWADVEVIEPKGARPRVVLFGESVARGYFYDPHFNPATALGHLMAAGAGEIEVVDLARTDQRRTKLLDLVKAAKALEPDALVIFAGNNWASYEGLSTVETFELGRLLREPDGMKKTRDALERRLFALTTDFCTQVAAAHAGIPIVVVIPEFNLADWHADVNRPPPALDGDTNARWARLHQELAEVGVSDPLRARNLARQLVELDGGTCPASATLLARLHTADGNLAEARRLLELARDCDLWMPLPSTPRIFSVTQAAMRAQAANGLTIVDLPDYFAKARSGALPDRTLFHDYCHLTLPGMQLAMSAVVERLAPSLFKKQASVDALRTHRFGLPPEVEARAHLLAAQHNSTWGQAPDVVRHHVARALECAPSVAKTMAEVADMTTRTIPPSLSSAFNTLVINGEMSIARFNLAWFPLFRTSLVNAIVELTESENPELSARIRKVRSDSHAVGVRPSSLLRPWYCLSSTQQTDRLVEGGAYYRSYGNRNDFRFVLTEPAALQLVITHRTRASTGRIRISLNGTPLGELEAAAAWTRRTLDVEASVARADLNELSLEWPIAESDPQSVLSGAADRIEFGLKPDVYPVVADVHELTVRVIG